MSDLLKDVASFFQALSYPDPYRLSPSASITPLIDDVLPETSYHTIDPLDLPYTVMIHYPAVIISTLLGGACASQRPRDQHFTLDVPQNDSGKSEVTAQDSNAGDIAKEASAADISADIPHVTDSTSDLTDETLPDVADTPDISQDVPADVPLDAAPDTPLDVQQDVPPDAPPETSPDVQQDISPETSLDVQPDVPPDVPDAPDTPPQPSCELQTPTPASCPVQDMAAGLHSTCVIKSGDVFCWGLIPSNIFSGPELFKSASPQKIGGFGAGSVITLYRNHVCVLNQAKEVWCMGQNAYGQLGNGNQKDSAIPVKALTGMSGVDVGSFHSCAWDATGKVYCWGYNMNHQLGVTPNSWETKPVAVSLPASIDSLKLGALFTYAQKSGTAYVWGSNDYGQLALPVAKFVDPTLNTVVKGIDLIAAADDFTLFRTSSCGVAVVGNNGAGQLGQGKAEDKTTSTLTAISLKEMSVIAAGGQTACALSNKGALSCWGNNSHGQTGTGLADSVVANPTPVKGLSAPVVKVVVGETHTCILDSGCKVYCAGLNKHNQLGGSTVSQSTQFIQTNPF